MEPDNAINLSQNELFAKIYSDYFHRLCAFAFKMTKNRQEAEDAVHDVFLKLWEDRRAKIVISCIRSYLFKSVYTECIRLYRQKKVHEKYLECFKSAGESDLLLELMYREMTGKMQQVIENMPQRCRQIYRMSREENLTHEEIAQKLSISVHTVRAQIKTVLKRIRQKMKEFVEN